MVTPTRYARFAKRDLDKTSWLAPLVNNRLGDLFNVELRHEQVFFVEGDRIVEDVGYSEKGRRFSESEFGKPIKSLADLARYGYWFVGRTYDLDAMREALRRQQDGHYYSIFSNQCQDWADRLARRAASVERARHIAPSWWDERRHRFDSDPEVRPTEPASIVLALLAILLGIGGFLAAATVSVAFTTFIGALFVIAGLSNVAYALHARDWNNLMLELITGIVHVAVGGLLLWNRDFVRTASAGIIAVGLVVHGLINVVGAGFGKPRAHWIGKLAAGLVMLASATVIASHWPASGPRVLGEVVGLSLLAGGISTIFLSWKTRAAQATE